MRVTIIGGGILGTAHALEAVQRGHHVTQLEREVEARGATVRNFGLVWVSGRAPFELDVALRSRELWEDIGARIPGVGFRPAGSVTLLRTPREVAVARGSRRAARRRPPRVRTPRARPGPRAEPRTARQVPCRTALFARRRGRVAPGDARDPRVPGGHRTIRVRAGHRGAVRRRPRRARRPRAGPTRATSSWSAPARRTAG